MSTQKPWQSGKLEKEAQQSEKRCLETSCNRLTSPERFGQRTGNKVDWRLGFYELHLHNICGILAVARKSMTGFWIPGKWV